jgi:uncharacterized alkaline shock family protein YloU
MMHKQDSRTDSGTIRIHRDVIASIACLAAGETEGVKGIGRDLKANIMELFGKKSSPSSVRVEFENNDEVKIEIPLIIKYGFNIPDVANKVQENIRNRLEKMTNLSIKDININIWGIERG